MTAAERYGTERLSEVPKAPMFRSGKHTISSRDPTQGQVVREFAQSMHTQVYLDKHFIEPVDLDERGMFTDEYNDRATYVVAENGQRYSACRYIAATKKEGLMSLPTPRHFALDAKEVQDVAGTRLVDLRASEVVEISGLVSVKREDKEVGHSGDLNATWLLHSAALRESLDQGHKLWLLNTHETLIRQLEIILGPDQIHRLGAPMDYMGSMTVPVAINPQSVVTSALNDDSIHGEAKRHHLMEALPGVNADKLSKETKAALERRGIPYVKTPRLERLVKSPKTWVNTALGAYALARAAPLPAIDQFHGDWRVFLALDLVTVAPYTWGITTAATGTTRRRRLVGASAAVGGFATPYAYLIGTGDHYPPIVDGAIAGFVGLATLQEVAKNRRNKRIFRELEAVK
ncbi:MAG: hypothetical protein ABIQ04_00075 [Candidatus Saccharimonadales bacterium]